MTVKNFTYFGACLLVGFQGSAAVFIQSPPNGATVSSPIQVSASNTGRSVAAMSVYVDNTLVLRKSTTQSIRTAVNLAAGQHTVTVLAQSYRGSSVAVSSITVPSPGPSKPAPPPTPSVPVTPPSSGISTASQISADMQGRNEGFPHGVPSSYDWANGPVVVMGNNSTGWKALTAWGALYEAAEGNPAKNTRVNIRNVQTYFLQKSSAKWLLLQNTSTPDGAAYVEDFSGDSNKPADIRSEPDGTISATAGSGFNFHFYPRNRGVIDPNDIGGIVTVLQARLISADPNKPDDRNVARFLCGAGADYYPALTGSWPGNSDFNPAVALGKMKYVQSEWRSFAMTTLTSSQLESNPPPISLSGILP